MTATALRDLARRHATAIGTAGGLVLVLLTCKLIPSATSSSVHGAPWAILFQGLVDGLLTALSAAGIVLIYRTTRVLNFAQTAIGAGGAVLTFDLLQLTPVPFWLDVPLGLITAGALGVAFDLIFGRRFARAPRLVLTVLTIISAGLLSGAGQTVIDTLPFFPGRDVRTLPQLTGSASLRPLMPLSGFNFRFPDLDVHFGFPELFAIACALLALAGIGAFLRYTKAGIAVRAMAESTERAALLGISVGLLSLIVWGLAGVLSGLSVTLQGLVTTPAVTLGFAPSLLLPALAAAVVARMSSIPVAAAAAVGIAVLDQSVRFLQPDVVPLISFGLLAMVAAGLLLQGRRRQGRGDRGATSSWVATEEPRPIPREMLGLGPVRLARWGVIALGLGLVCIYPFITSTQQTFLGAVIAIYAIVGLSLVVLTGWAGQVSLGQFAFAAIGAVLAGALAQKLGLTFWLAVPIASLLTAGVAVAVGLPALRIPGLFLAVATFAFAVVVRQLLFSERRACATPDWAA